MKLLDAQGNHEVLLMDYVDLTQLSQFHQKQIIHIQYSNCFIIYFFILELCLILLKNH